MMKTSIVTTLILLVVMFQSLTGCTKTYSHDSGGFHASRPATDITKASYMAADALISQIQPAFPPETSVIATTLVNINRLDLSAPLGRLITEQVSGRFAQKKYQMLEVKLRNDIYMKRNEGELVLTREVRDIARRHNARAIIAGTFTDRYDRVFVSIKVIDFETNVVLGAVDYFLERDDLIRSLLQVN